MTATFRSTHVLDALAKYPCGPGGHNQRNLGIFFSGTVPVGPGLPEPKADKPIWTCDACGLHGGFMTCIFCGESDQVTPQTVANRDLGREASGELCTKCFSELMGEGVNGWRLGRTVQS